MRDVIPDFGDLPAWQAPGQTPTKPKAGNYIWQPGQGILPVSAVTRAHGAEVNRLCAFMLNRPSHRAIHLVLFLKQDTSDNTPCFTCERGY